MSVIFSIIGFTVFGIVLRLIFQEKTIQEKPKDKSDLIYQLIISLILGAMVWAFLPKDCSKYSDTDYDPYEHRKQ
jgi:prolipoprotein diacylglyceryltransferase